MSDEWRKRRVTVMGLGRFGGGVGVTRWLAAQGARVTVTDKQPAEKLKESLAQVGDLDIELRLGGHEARDFENTDLVVVNPAVPPSAEELRLAERAGVTVSTEINLFVERCPARCVGVTGSVGKSTITAMIGHVLEAGVAESGARIWVGGNIGRSLLDGLGRISADDTVVLELSSFQLERTPLVRWSPHVAVVASITPNHLDWHGSFAAYVAAKLNIVRFREAGRDAVIVQDTPEMRELVKCHLPHAERVWWYGLDGEVPMARSGEQRVTWPEMTLSVPGRHNRLNAAAALCVAHVLGLAPQRATEALGTFEALPHRLQRVAEVDGVVYYDDSKSTTPEAAITALHAMDRPTLVILGGYDKGSDLGALAWEVAARARLAACIGKTGPGLAEAIRAAGGNAEDCGELMAAVAACRARAKPGDAVLLSPACASWDQFVDYRERGLMFARLVHGA